MLLSRIKTLFPIGSNYLWFVRAFAGTTAMLLANVTFAQQTTFENGPIKLVVITPDGAWQVDHLDGGYLTMTVKNGLTGEVEAELALTPCPEDVRERDACLPTVSAGRIARDGLKPAYELLGDTDQSDLIVVIPVARLDVPEGDGAYVAAAEILRNACGNNLALSDCMTGVSDENWAGFLLQRESHTGQVTVSPLNEYGAIVGEPPEISGVFIPQSIFGAVGASQPVAD